MTQGRQDAASSALRLRYELDELLAISRAMSSSGTSASCSISS
jgi:hypothetical protein